jgi:hypothetical protein
MAWDVTTLVARSGTAAPGIPNMPLLRRCIDFLRQHLLLTFLLMGVFFLLSGIMSIDLYVVLKANIDLFRQYGALAIEDGALRQLLGILGTAFFSIVFFVLFVVCERIVVDRLTGTLRDLSREAPSR